MLPTCRNLRAVARPKQIEIEFVADSPDNGSYVIQRATSREGESNRFMPLVLRAGVLVAVSCDRSFLESFAAVNRGQDQAPPAPAWWMDCLSSIDDVNSNS